MMPATTRSNSVVWIPVIFCMFLCLSRSALGAPDTQPSEELLWNSRIHITPPDGYTVGHHADDTLQMQFVNDDKSATINVIVTPQEAAPSADMARQMGLIIGEKTRKQVAQAHQTFRIQPKVEKDERFFLKIHDSIAAGDKVMDREQIYRVMGLGLVTVISIAWTDDTSRATELHAVAETMLDHATLHQGVMPGHKDPNADAAAKLDAPLDTKGRAPGERPATAPSTRPARPFTLTKARLRITPPAPLPGAPGEPASGWTIDPADAPSGMVLTMHVESDPTLLIAVSVHPLPPEARDDPKIRDAVLDDLVAGERESLRGAKMSGDTKTETDARFLRKTTTDYDVNGKPVRVTARQRLVGQVLVDVVAVGAGEASDALSQTADKFCLDLKPVGSIAR